MDDYIRWIDLLIGSVGLFIGFYSLVVNFLLLFILIRMSRRSVSDTVFCHLAVTDIMASLDAIFAFGILLSDRTFFDFYIFDDVICQFTGITWCVVSIATPLLLSIISLGRFLALYVPHRYETWYSPPLANVLVAVSWIISIIGGTMHIWKLEPMRMNPKWGYCDYRLVDIYTKTQVRYIVIFLYSCPLSISTTLLLVCNVSVALRLIRLQSLTRSAARRDTTTSDVDNVTCSTSLARSSCVSRVQFRKPLAALTAVLNLKKPAKCSDVVFSNAPHDTTDYTTNDVSMDFELTVTEHTIDRGRNKVAPQTSGRGLTVTTVKKGRSTTKRRKKEKQVIIATLLFSLNFGICYFVMLYYYFSYMISPTYDVFQALSRSDPVKDTYILGWFYYATFLSSSINPLIHFCCNSKIRTGARSLFNCLRNKMAAR